MNKAKSVLINIAGLLASNYILIPVMIFLVITSQHYLLRDTLTLGFKPDDWILYFAYKALGSDPLSKIVPVWNERGLYTTYQVYYMGLLDYLFGLNYFFFHLSSLILKTIAIVLLYPLILVLFKRKLLAFLTVILFSFSHSAVGPLEFVVKGSDYLAIIWMLLFLLIYYYLVINKLAGWRYLFLLLTLFILSIASSPIRAFPLIAIPPLIEALLIIRQCRWINITKSFTRLFFIYSPFIFFFVYISPPSPHGLVYGPLGMFNKALQDKLYILLSPISGMGYTLITNDYMGKVFGSISVDTLKNYFYFLLGGPTVVCGVITVVITWSGIKKYKALFFFLVTFINFMLQIALFYIIPREGYFNYTNIYSVIFGIYIMLIGISIFLYWLKWGKDNRVLVGFWIGSAFLFIFTFLTWLFAPVGTEFSATSYYLVIASIGSSLMVAAFLASACYKVRSSKIKFLTLLPLLAILPIFYMSGEAIRSYFFNFNILGRGAAGQVMMQEKVKKALEDLGAGDFALVYFDTSEIGENRAFYLEGFLTSFPSFMRIEGGKVIEGCTGIIYEDTNIRRLKESLQIRDGIKGFNAPALCVSEEKSSYNDSFFTSNQFYAFKIKDRNLIDIKKDVLKKLEF